MSQLPESTSHSMPARPAPQPGPSPSVVRSAAPQPELVRTPDGDAAAGGYRSTPQRIPPWLERSELFLRVLLRMYIGLAITVAPWWPLFWDQNPLFLRFPTLAIYAASGAVRGVVSGLGILNLWIAFRDAVRNREE